MFPLLNAAACGLNVTWFAAGERFTSNSGNWKVKVSLARRDEWRTNRWKSESDSRPVGLLEFGTQLLDQRGGLIRGREDLLSQSTEYIRIQDKNGYVESGIRIDRTTRGVRNSDSEVTKSFNFDSDFFKIPIPHAPTHPIGGTLFKTSPRESNWSWLVSRWAKTTRALDLWEVELRFWSIYTPRSYLQQGHRYPAGAVLAGWLFAHSFRQFQWSKSAKKTMSHFLQFINYL